MELTKEELNDYPSQTLFDWAMSGLDLIKKYQVPIWTFITSFRVSDLPGLKLNIEKAYETGNATLEYAAFNSVLVNRVELGDKGDFPYQFNTFLNRICKLVSKVVEDELQRRK